VNREKAEEIQDRNVMTFLRKRAVIIVAILILVVAGAAGLWLLRGFQRVEGLQLNPPKMIAVQPSGQTSSELQNPSEVKSKQKNPAGTRSTLSSKSNQPRVQTVTITLSNRGYQPDNFTLQKDVPARITFVRTDDNICGAEIVISEYDIKRELPLNEPIVVEFTPAKTGDFKFACGMNMMSGKIIVQ
jgi:Cupredoxin-like domain